MRCARCGKDIEGDSGFCRHCGSTVRQFSGSARRLFRRPAEGRLAGVCAGIAEYFAADVTLVRLAWVVLSIVPGAFIGGLVAYVAAWMVMPSAGPEVERLRVPSKRLLRSATDRKLAGVCGGIGAYLGVDSTIVRLVWVVLTIVPGAIVCGLGVYALAWFIVPEEHDAPASVATSPA